MAMAQAKKMEAPVPGPDTKAFWDAAAKGKLMIKKCAECGKKHYYPRANCPYCLSAVPMRATKCKACASELPPV